MRLWDEAGGVYSRRLTPDTLWLVEYLDESFITHAKRVEAPSEGAARWYLESDGYQVVSVEQVEPKKLN